MSRTSIDPSLTPSVQPNIIDNGGFEVWQRGTSFSNPTGNTYVADRWKTLLAASTLAWTVSQESTNIDTGAFSLKANITSVSGATDNRIILQLLENQATYANRTLSLSMRVKSNVANVAIVAGSANDADVYSSVHPGDNAWHTLTLTYTVSSNPGSNLHFGIAFDTTGHVATGTIYIDSAVLSYGSGIPAFIPLPPMVDLARCQRFYETGRFNVGSLAMKRVAGIPYIYSFFRFAVVKRVVPTMTSTIAEIDMSHSPTTGNTEVVSDQANWSGVNYSLIETSGANATVQRSTDQTTYPVAYLNYTWTASADL